ncbi:hypothetical protein CK203_054159 [Vitis vinifera]|uniref:Reverse transcriptase domain-containing protein n=1 Tax=Vitis vinifera TaxID=29760 RepID=A0A438FU36_VITVI|nr:hypothetical protein CK203_054159 [Vitis vinifera]
MLPSQREMSNQGRLTGAMRRFAQVVDELELLDLPMQGGCFHGAGGWWFRRGPSPFRFENMWLKVDGFKDLLRETHWRQVSRELWLKEGDKNTGFFHRMANAIEETTPWKKLRSMGGGWRREQEPFIEEEIHSAMMEMNGDKAPGLDGFTVAFWQSC